MSTVSRLSDRETTTVWVCVDCIAKLANDEDSPGADREPLSAIDFEAGDEITPGMMLEEHGCDTPRECEEECETDAFSRDDCEGCGTKLAGERHAATLWLA